MLIQLMISMSCSRDIGGPNCLYALTGRRGVIYFFGGNFSGCFFIFKDIYLRVIPRNSVYSLVGSTFWKAV